MLRVEKYFKKLFELRPEKEISQIIDNKLYSTASAVKICTLSDIWNDCHTSSTFRSYYDLYRTNNKQYFKVENNYINLLTDDIVKEKLSEANLIKIYEQEFDLERG